jgi:hypothetical protein
MAEPIYETEEERRKRLALDILSKGAWYRELLPKGYPVSDKITAPLGKPIDISPAQPPPLEKGEYRLSPYEPPKDPWSRLLQSRAPEWLNKVMPSFEKSPLPTVPQGGRSVQGAIMGGVEAGVMFAPPMKWAKEAETLWRTKTIVEKVNLVSKLIKEGKLPSDITSPRIGSMAFKDIPIEAQKVINEELLGAGKVIKAIPKVETAPKIAKPITTPPEAIQGQEIIMGKPVAVKLYRGVPAEESVLPQRQDFGKGKYFSPQKEVAETYAGEVGKIEEVVTELKNPYVMVEDSPEWKKIASVAAKARTTAEKKGLGIAEQEVAASEAIPNYVMKQGHDALVVKRASGDVEVVLFGQEGAGKVKGGMIPPAGVEKSQGVVEPIVKGGAKKATPKVETAPETVVAPKLAKTPNITQAIPESLSDKLPFTIPQTEKGLAATIPNSPLVKQLTQLIRLDKTAWKPTGRMRSAESAQRAAKIEGILKTSSGQEAFYKAKGAIKGEMPVSTKVSQAGKTLTDANKNSLADVIGSSELRPYEKLNAFDGLTDIYSGQLPGMYELYQLEKVFGVDFSKAVINKFGAWHKIWESVTDVANIPRALLSSGDLSATLRQGGWFIPSHPVISSKAFVAQIKAFASGNSYKEVMKSIRESPHALWADKSKLYLADISTEVQSLAAREESFMSKLVQNAPIVKQSQRAYVTYLNKVRMDVWESVVTGWAKKGWTPTNHKVDFDNLARYINWSTGRGSLPKAASQAGGLLNATFFSPRLQLSRIGLPFYSAIALASGSKTVAKIAARDLVAFVGAGATGLALARLGGAKVELDPRSTQFGKVQIGNIKMDFWTGMQPWARYVAQIVSGQRKSASGRILPVDKLDVSMQFIRTKLAPMASLITSLFSGKTVIGEDIWAKPTWKTLRDNLLFLSAQDIADAVADSGLKGGLIASPGLLGAGVQTYEIANSTVSDLNQTTSQIQLEVSKANELLAKHDFDGLQKLIDKNPQYKLFVNPDGQSVSSAATKLISPLTAKISNLKELRKKIELNPDIPDETKKSQLDQIDSMTIELAAQALLIYDGIPVDTGQRQQQPTKPSVPSVNPAPVETKPAITQSQIDTINQRRKSLSGK